MTNYILSCCSTADLSKEHLENRNINYICFHYTLDDKEYPDDLGQTIPFKDFYDAMRNGGETRTSQISISEYLDYFTSFLKEGKDVLHLTLSSGISGSANSARNAAAIASEQYPDRKIYVVDSLAASSGYGLLMDKLADLRDGGMDIDDLRDWAENNKRRLHHWFFSTDLTFYVKGGRVSKAAGLFGGILKICPLLHVDHNGRLIPKKKVQGKSKVINEIVKTMEKYVDDGVEYNGKCYLCHSDCIEDANAVVALIEEKFHNLEEKPLINNIGTTIGSHSGPGTVAVFFWGEERREEN